MSNPNTASRFGEIYDSTSKAALAFITARCRRTADVGDIFQETYLELYQVLLRRGANYVTNDKALILRIAKRKIARYYSLLERLKIVAAINATGNASGAANDAGEEIELSELEADSFLTEDFAINQIMLETVWQAMREKPEEVKKVFYLFYAVGLSIPEIAETLALSESGVKNKLYRTLKELRNLLK